VTDFDAFDSRLADAFRDSGFDARGRSPDAAVRPVVVGGIRQIFYGCVGESYPTTAPSCTPLTPPVQTFELVWFPGGADTNVRWTATGLPAGLALSDPDPTDNLVDLVGTPTAAGDPTFTLTGSGDVAEAEGAFVVRIRRAVQWTNVGDWLPAGYSSDGTMLLAGSYNWLLPLDSDLLFWVGAACSLTDPAAVLRIDVDPTGTSSARLNAIIGAGGQQWIKTGTPTVAPGDYDALSPPPAVASIVEL
jgi:hypothetical protein